MSIERSDDAGIEIIAALASSGSVGDVIAAFLYESVESLPLMRTPER